MKQETHESSAQSHIAKGNWKQFKGKVKDRWGKLTNDQLDRVEGQRDKLAGEIQEAYGKSRKEAEEEIERFEKENENELRGSGAPSDQRDDRLI